MTRKTSPSRPEAPAESAAATRHAGSAAAPSRRPPGRPTSQESDRLRQAVLDAARQVFVQRGFEAASIDAIAQEAKVARITIYRQFVDKEGLFREVVALSQDRVQQHLEAAIDTQGAPPEVLRRILAALHETMSQPDFLDTMRMLTGEAVRFPDVVRASEVRLDAGLRPLIDYLTALDAQGVICEPAPRETAVQMAALSAGGLRYLIRPPSGHAQGRARWVESLYTLFAHHWGLLSAPQPARPGP